jgi:hypothetical protein
MSCSTYPKIVSFFRGFESAAGAVLFEVLTLLSVFLGQEIKM